MATLTTTTMMITPASSTTSQFISLRFSRSRCAQVLANPCSRRVYFRNMQYGLCRSFQVSHPSLVALRSFNSPISALDSGLEASITDSKENSSFLKNAEIVVESEDGNKLQLRVDLTGDQTQRIFNQVLTNLARTAPPIPGFRRQKGGKTTKVPPSFLLQTLGEERVIKFVIQEILNSTMADYVRKENLDVKNRDIRTIQTAEELKQSFTPGNEFGFSVIIEPPQNSQN